MMAISPMLSPMKKRSVVVKKCGDSTVPKMTVQMSSTNRTVSQRTSSRDRRGPAVAGMLSALVATRSTSSGSQGAWLTRRAT